MAKKPEVKYEMQDGADPADRFAQLSPINVNASASGIAEIMNQVGIVSVSQFMVNSGGLVKSTLAITNPYKLTIRTGRLSKSILNAFSFSVANLPLRIDAKIAKQLGKKFIKGTTEEKFEDGRKEGFRKVFYDKTRKIVNGEMGTKVPYAHKHEKGIGTPKRPFLEPAVEKVRPRMAGIIEKKLAQAYKKTDWK